MSLHDPYEHLPEGAKHLMDALSVGTLLGTLVGAGAPLTACAFGLEG